ncbi:MAG: ThuA domain-containing protein [Propionibacteriaceae bacterium]|nr:ThuA domain-containing protein [Propionibacteriaceae bacterium]
MSTTRPTRALVLVNGDDTHHDLLAASPILQQLGVDADLVTDRGMGMNRFIDPRPATADADVYLLYTSGGAFPTAQQEALASAVRAGKGVVALHCANLVGFGEGGLEADRPLFDLLGNRYLSHGPGYHEGRQTVEFVGEHPITQGLENFEIFDEYYEYAFADDGHQVLATRARVEDGVAIPLMYTREVGAGRVVYLALGHDLRAWGEPGFRTLVKRSLRWAAGLEVEA